VSDVRFRSDVSVELIQSVGTDLTVVQAARISTGRDSVPVDIDDWTKSMSEADGLIRFLMKNRHGTPFEHNLFTFRIEAPIFVWREFMRHRIGFSYNEESGRYKQLEPVFYVPARERNLVQQGKAGAYTFVPGNEAQYGLTQDSLRRVYEEAYTEYEFLLGKGIAKEVARMCLPVAIYSSAYVTCNARSLMSFLSLRTKHEDSKFPSFPQREIEMVAEQMEDYFVSQMPLTAAAFREYGRVSP
jgi:thymidylate synthase (FAD)